MTTEPKAEATPTKGQVVAADISALLRARNPLLWIVTGEEARVESYLFEAAAAAGYVPRTWDVGQGVCKLNGLPEKGIGSTDTGETFAAIQERADEASTGKAERGVWIMRDLPGWLTGPAGMATLRQLRNLARFLPGVPRDCAQAIIILSPSGDVPPELSNHATVIEWPLPDRQEISSILDAALEALDPKLRAKAVTPETREASIDAAIGLSGEEAAACFARSLVQLRAVDPAAVSKEKRRVIARERVLEWYDPLPGGLDAVGGLENVKDWLIERELAFAPAAREYGLPSPKGAMVVGISGCGKTLLCKATATAWAWPLIRVDLGALKSKFVGDSEAIFRRALKVIETIDRCIVWFDEIEKGLQGATSGSADGGVSSDQLGALLTWMQERKGNAFVMCTANDVRGLPPEFLRKGRFDEVWFVDLPTLNERTAVLDAALRTHNRQDAEVDHFAVAKACEGFTGSEVAELVPTALFAAFADKARQITTDDLLAAAAATVPLSKTADAKFKELREWASTRARPATKAEAAVESKTSKSRSLDIES